LVERYEGGGVIQILGGSVSHVRRDLVVDGVVGGDYAVLAWVLVVVVQLLQLGGLGDIAECLPAKSLVEAHFASGVLELGRVGGVAHLGD
jgi:hypothetical protein